MTEPAVARAFARAAPDYDHHARVQLGVARALAAMIPSRLPGGLAVDLGAGTAALARELARRVPGRSWLAVDLVPGMLREARARGRLEGPWRAVAADALKLPLADASVALVWSSFALQWSVSPGAALAETGRVLRPGGIAVLAMPVAGTLRELAASWAAVDDRPHVNPLAAEAEWEAAAGTAGLRPVERRTQEIREHYPDLGAVVRMLRGTGAQHVRREGAGLTTPARRRALESAYGQLREPEGLPVTWRVQFLVLEKRT